MDNQLVFDLFTKTIGAAQILNTDKELIVKLEEAVKRLPPMQIGKWGQYKNGCTIGIVRTITTAMFPIYTVFSRRIRFHLTGHRIILCSKNFLIARGDESTGWSMGWKVNLWARFS